MGCLYGEKTGSRSNAPIDTAVAALVLKDFTKRWLHDSASKAVRIPTDTNCVIEGPEGIPEAAIARKKKNGESAVAGIKDVARYAGVGVGTVSRMINGSGYVSEESREKIQAAMKALDYTPNELARNLYRKKSGIIAVLVPNVSNPFFAEFIDCVEEELYTDGFKVMLCNTAKNSGAEAEYLNMLKRHIVDGVISCVSSLGENYYSTINKPVVAVDRYLGDHIPVVTVDHREGGRLAAELLLENGCRRILHFRGAGDINTPYYDRHSEFQRVMNENKIETCCYELAWDRMDSEYYIEAVDHALQSGFNFDGVFAVDRIAIECMNRCLLQNRKIPEDVKIVAYDGTFITDTVEPKVTAVVQPIALLARESAKLISSLIAGKQPEQMKIVLKASLRKRRTTLS